MNTTPPSFGDPTKVDRENSAAVRKGVLFGCGGCALLLAAGMAAATAIVVLVMFLMRSDETCRLTLEAAQASAVMQRELGEPMHIGWLVLGDINKSGGHGSVDLIIPIVGPDGDAKVHAMATRENNEPWKFSRMEAVISKTGQKVDLR